MIAVVDVDARAAFVKFDAIGPSVRQLLRDELGPLPGEIAASARSRALDHIHSLGEKPGQYLASIYGDLSDKDSRVVGFVRSTSPVAHLLELGFTIKDMIIEASIGSVMATETPVAAVFGRVVHRHETKVEPYPAIEPAFEARRDDIMAALQRVADKVGS